MAHSPALAPGCTRPVAPDRHPPSRSVPLALSRLGVRRPASTEHAQPSTTAEEQTIHDLRVLFFGDSFVAGTGDPEARGWVGRIAAGLPMSAYNLGVRRETSVQVAARWRAEALPRIAHGADTRVVFSFGANDATVEECRVRVEPVDTVRALRAALDGAAELGLPAFVVGPPPVADPGHADRIEALSALLARACDVPY